MNSTKRLLSVLMAVVLLMLPCLSCVASAQEANSSAGTNVQRNIDCPHIYVHGFVAKDLIADPNDEDSEVYFPPAADKIVSNVLAAVPALLKFTVTRNYEELSDVIAEKALNILGPCMNDNYGNTVSGGVYFKYPPANTIKTNSILNFNYDWRADPFVVADQLNDYINYVLEASGASKVTIECHSLGGVVTMCYLAVYGNSKIAGVCFNTTAIYGETYTGVLFNGNIELISDAITNYMYFAFDGADAENLLVGLFDFMQKTGITDIVCNLGNSLVNNLYDYLVPAAAAPLFSNWLPIWYMVPDEYIEGAMEYMLNNSNYTEEEKAVIESKINRYNTLVRANRDEILADLDENAKIAVISRYGYSGFPITAEWKSMSDGVIDTKYSSMGATVAKYGEQLSDEQIANVDPAFISPDKTIDASTAKFADRTWFIKYYPHSYTCDSYEEMVLDLLYSDEECTVDTYEQYPRFMIYDHADKEIHPDVAQSEEEASETGLKLIVSKLKEFILKIQKTVAGFFSSAC